MTGQVNTDAVQGPGVPRRRPATSPAAPLAPSAGCEVKRESLSRARLWAVSWTIQSMGFSRSEYWSGEPFPSPGDLPNPGIEPRFPAWQVDSLPAEPQGMPKNMEWIAYPFSRGSSRTGIEPGSPALLANSLPTELS